MRILSNYLSGFLKLNFSISPKEASLIRITYALYFICVYGLEDFTGLGGMPHFFYFPHAVSVNAILPGYPSEMVMLVLQVFVFITLIAVLIGYRTFLFSILFTLLEIWLHSFLYSLGKIDHNFLLIFMPICMAFANWGNHFSLDERLGRKTNFLPNIGISILAISVAFSYFTAAYAKWAGHWLSFDTLPLKTIILSRNTFWDWLPDWIFEIGEWFTVIFELAFIVLYPYKKVFYLVTYVAISFHIMVFYTTGIAFLSLPIVYLPFQIFPLKKWILSLDSKKIVNFIVIPFAVILIAFYIPFLMITGQAIVNQPLLLYAFGLNHQLFVTCFLFFWLAAVLFIRFVVGKQAKI